MLLQVPTLNTASLLPYQLSHCSSCWGLGGFHPSDKQIKISPVDQSSWSFWRTGGEVTPGEPTCCRRLEATWGLDREHTGGAAGGTCLSFGPGNMRNRNQLFSLELVSTCQDSYPPKLGKRM